MSMKLDIEAATAAMLQVPVGHPSIESIHRRRAKEIIDAALGGDLLAFAVDALIAEGGEWITDEIVERAAANLLGEAIREPLRHNWTEDGIDQIEKAIARAALREAFGPIPVETPEVLTGSSQRTCQVHG